jgi:hypothetical protein
MYWGYTNIVPATLALASTPSINQKTRRRRLMRHRGPHLGLAGRPGLCGHGAPSAIPGLWENERIV